MMMRIMTVMVMIPIGMEYLVSHSLSLSIYIYIL